MDLAVAASPAVTPLPAAEPAPAASPTPWPFLTRVAFRFAFSWLFLIIEPFPFRDIPGLGWLAWLFDKALDKPFHWTSLLAARLMHYTGPLELPSNGSGDRTVDWVQNFACLILACVATLVWCALDRRPRRHDRLYTFLRVYARYWLAASLFGYGLEKLFVLQMPIPNVMRLEEAFGDASPMGMLWTFLGASPPYERFTGLAELTGCFLLLSRRTALLGALTVAGVMFNVVLFNLCYDVPVKLYSSTLFLTAVFLCLKDAPRILAFVRSRPVAAQPRFVARSRRGRIALVALELVAALGLVAQQLWSEHQLSRQFGGLSTPLPIEGRWLVERQVLDGHELPPLLTEDQRWHFITISRYGKFLNAYVRRVDGMAIRARGEVDDAKHTLRLTTVDGKPWPTLSYAVADAGHVTLQDDQQHWVLTLRKLPPREYLLLTRGFHWINEAPFNR